MSVNDQMSQASHVICGNSNVSNETVFHAVYVPEENIDNSTENNIRENSRIYTDKTEALKVIREYKTGRLKSFKKRSEAEEYAKTGFEKTHCNNNSSVPAAVPVVEEKSNNYKAPRSQELVCFRKLIKDGDLYSVKCTVWANPRYLIGSGDTPAILQEGCRYNALHIAVRADRSDMCELILNTVGNTEFIKLLYGDECKSYVDRAQIMLDLYLNTPDKGLNETPLHFAVKFGLKNVVRVLVSYPCCIKTLPNKYKQPPIDIICSRTCQEDEELKKEIRLLLEDQYYVPVLRSDDSTLQPVIGEPFSPTSPLSIKTDPISPRLEVRAFAGPMTKSLAVEFRKKWKTPPRLRMTPIRKVTESECNLDSSVNNLSLRLQDTEKGLERVGRNLAEEYQVSWKEYWPFLNDFADFRTTEGLMKLEKYLEYKFHEQLLQYNQNYNGENSEKQIEPADEIDYLCNKLQSCSLFNTDNQDNDVDELEFYTPPSSPKLLVDSSDDEMQIADEGPVTFLEGSALTKLDYAVYYALPPSIKSVTYPNIYRWQHDMQLVMNRDLQRTNNARLPRRKLILTP
ncbi:PREDICTED: ankyrin repeat and LEM domain-containing protein 2 [Dufourea novaeangliae]|uniref:Ankyrin repeat and LEM domain-containing protein 2 n=1 Tax=Dufourea novaeangliae TaxID=178035 RepID=A0A154PFL1_DUFNO|nr:PREDICTED: ankyrin repeat and LEM domain-containing protein 2 [Dufourea novaeangliae]KZC10098.1 Ankyrin repeat and LEM domain-containing protein 2 [Dufourea novaeangliae]